MARLREQLGGDLRGVILGGSAVLGAYEPGRSDVDVLAVSDAPLERARASELAAAVSHRALPCPARKLELVVYSDSGRALELNIDTGEGEEHVGLDPSAEAPHWFVIDRSIARARGRPLLGPAPRELLDEVPRGEVLEALRGSLEWYRREDPDSPNAVLNASRAWRFARTGHWTSKAAAAKWARGRMSDPTVVEAALVARAAGERLEPGEVAGFLDAVAAALAAARP